MLIARRSLLGLAAAVACPLCSRVLAADTAPHWGYEGAAGPDHWSDLSADFRACALGTQQSPIDLIGAIKADPGSLVIDYQKMPLRVWNNGHTIQVNTPPGSKLRTGSVSYDLRQFHFHHPSEHLLAGKRFDMECHFVNQAADGSLAVIGVFIKPGAANASLAPIWQAMPSEEGSDKAVAGVTIDTIGLLPKHRSYLRYMGSLTSPPCSETVTWSVFRTPVEASPEQIRRFAALFPMNARPLQQEDRRFVLQAGG